MAARILTRPEVGDRLGVSLSTVRRLIASGDLRAFNIGRQVRILESEVDRYVARQVEVGAR